MIINIIIAVIAINLIPVLLGLFASNKIKKWEKEDKNTNSNKN